ncbi:predicted protein [Naegleria gruberi]|uniref:Predicted protein n=1 Tax=Naegleria gruberi TaxID=5762 RepID=D2W1X0_NAEGR|nr:uncharacterized protein NAEGRDRAFT_75298 [Naegleria gruberi]EFC36938.1 predicted protein [Naegleria gruberi]|eukprot:XP_002669682.1 predicted protein [Naegleria gruberi strain NEG-M]
MQGLVELIERTVTGIAKLYPESPQLSRKKFESKILSDTQSKRLYTEILEGIEKGIPRLLFRASENGFTGSDFHSKCDAKGRTVTIIKSTNGAIFGGYAATSWTSNSSYCFDSNCFLFSIISGSGEERFTKMKNDGIHHSNTYSIYCNPNQGPSFGGGHDICISNNPKAQENYSNLGHSFSLTGQTYGTATIKSYLAGAYNFSVEDYEVFALQ